APRDPRLGARAGPGARPGTGRAGAGGAGGAPAAGVDRRGARGDGDVLEPDPVGLGETSAVALLSGEGDPSSPLPPTGTSDVCTTWTICASSCWTCASIWSAGRPEVRRASSCLRMSSSVFLPSCDSVTGPPVDMMNWKADASAWHDV